MMIRQVWPKYLRAIIKLRRASLLLSLFFVGLLGGYAQDVFNAGIQMGTLTPLGSFASQRPDATDAGFAKQGFTVQFDGDYFIHNRFAITGRLLMGTSQLDEAAYFAKLDNDVKAYLPDSAKTAHYNAGYWLWISPMAGVKFNYPIVLNQTWLEAGLFSGIQITQLPDQRMLLDDEAAKHLIITENRSKRSVSVPFIAELGLRFKANQSTYLTIKAGYHQSSAKYAQNSYLVKEQGNEDIRTVNYAVPLNSLQFSLGVSYNITRR